MNKEIREKIEIKRNELKEESERIRRESKENHTCPNCKKPVQGNRLYCSHECTVEFFINHDYSQASNILRNYKKQLEIEYEELHPRQVADPVSHPIARKKHECFFCGLDINAGEKYYKYIRLPGQDEYFEDYPYESLSYHQNCIDFIDKLEWDEYDEDMIEEFFDRASKVLKIPVEQLKEMVKNGERHEEIIAADEHFQIHYEEYREVEK